MRGAATKLCFLKLCMLSLVFCIWFLVLSIIGRSSETSREIGIEDNKVVFSEDNVNGTHSTFFVMRKLLLATADAGVNRIGPGSGSCSKNDILIFQGPTSTLPNGIPAFTVQILNACVAGCSISNIHVSCGWFSSARLVDPYVFKRLYYNDCLVNNGGPLGAGESLSFQYANSFSYPLSVASVVCG